MAVSGERGAGVLLVALFAGLIPVMFTLGGWQHALWIGGEVREPQRNIPRAIVFGVIIVVTVYLMGNWAYLRLLGFAAVRGTDSLAADAVATVWPAFGQRAVAGAVALSAFGVLNVQFLSGPRLVYAMARDGRFFHCFARVSRRFKTPYAAIVLLGTMALLLLFGAGEIGAPGQRFDKLDRLLTGVVFIDVFFFLLTGLALFVLRRKRPEVVRPVRVPAYPFVPGLFVLGEIGILVGAFLDDKMRPAAVIGAVWIGAAALCYLTLFRQRTGCQR